MADHSKPALASTYTNYTSELNGRIDDAGKWNSTALTSQPTNLPTDTVRWDATNFGWYRNNNTAASPNWVVLSTRYSINIDGIVGANTPAAGTFTTLVVNGPTAASGTGLQNLFAAPYNIGTTTACADGRFTALTVNTTCTLPAAATVTGGGTVVGTTASQTLTNKTLTAPAISSIVNTGTLTLPTATTTLVGTGTTDTLSNKTLTAPRIVTGGRIDDENGNEQIGFSTTASAITFINVTNGSTGVAPSITGTGEAVTNLNLKSTGTGSSVLINGTAAVDVSTAQTITNKAFNGTLGATTPSSIVCTTIDCSSSVTGAGFNSLASTIGTTLYPIGSIYINATNSANPSTFFGFGTWVSFGSGRVPVGFDAADAKFNTASGTGGTADAVVVSHTHTASFAGTTMGTHNHTASFSGTAVGNHTHGLITDDGYPGGIGGFGVARNVYTNPVTFNPSPGQSAVVAAGAHTPGGTVTNIGISAGTPSGTVTVTSAGVTATAANLQPYITVYMWRRTA